jgi:two-component system, chemotaxis family, protein-glutamate methylesterase/glutaminase
MIRVLIVEDSGVARELIRHILCADPDIRIIGTAGDGEEALEFVAKDKPDVITMDIIMPKMDGFEATRRIMETQPVPIVMVTATLVQEEVDRTWQAVEAGAVAVLEKPRYPYTDEESARLVQTVKLMSQVKLVRRWKRSAAVAPPQPAPAKRQVIVPKEKPARKDLAAVVVGASTGGPQALHQILSKLPADFPAPILLVQHISPGFTAGFVQWLNRAVPLEVRLPANGDRAQAGKVYVAPDGYHMKIDKFMRILLTKEDPIGGIRPSVSCLFRSAAEALGGRALGILLTGMGRDGAEELAEMKNRGATTIIQDEESCVVYGMPGEAAKLGAATYSFPPEKIAGFLQKLAK